MMDRLVSDEGERELHEYIRQLLAKDHFPRMDNWLSEVQLTLVSIS